MIKLRSTLYIFLIGIIASTSLSAEYRYFTGRNGKKIHAKIIKLDEKTVTLETSSGKTYKLIHNLFSQADQNYLKRKLEAKQNPTLNENSRIEISVKKSLRNNSANNNDYDDKRLILQPIVTITNKEIDKEFENVSITVLLVGKSAMKNGKTRKILLKDSFTVNLPRGDTVYRSQKRYSGTYDDNLYARYGYKYDGYMYVVQNEDGDVAFSRTPGSLTPEAALKLEQGRIYNRKFEPANEW